MKIKAYKFKKNGTPKKVTVEMSMDEAAFLTKIVGRMSPSSADTVIEGAGSSGLHSEIYDCLAGELFNRYYDDGVDGYINGDKR